MTKARLIKKQEIGEQQTNRQKPAVSRKALVKAVDSVTNWIDEQRQIAKIDPRKAFAELFGQPQTS
ncbi:MAG: hypothetical protein IPJ07_18485 [Acidobacteria bacterium]|nr:hypothetical protein [Acidobacteriota bacterium]